MWRQLMKASAAPQPRTYKPSNPSTSETIRFQASSEFRTSSHLPTRPTSPHIHAASELRCPGASPLMRIQHALSRMPLRSWVGSDGVWRHVWGICVGICTWILVLNQQKVSRLSVCLAVVMVYGRLRLHAAWASLVLPGPGDVCMHVCMYVRMHACIVM